jgi:hypothetical protein
VSTDDEAQAQTRDEKPVLAALCSDIRKLADGEEDSKRKHMLEILISGYNHLINDRRLIDVGQDEADDVRAGLGIQRTRTWPKE